MSTAVAEIKALPDVHYLNVKYGWKSWLFTTDHKRIAWLYLAAITFFFFVGGLAATLMRLNLIEPQGALVEPSTYNKLFTLHGLIMIFFFLAPSIPAGPGEFPHSSDDRRARRCISALESAQLVHLHARWSCLSLFHHIGRC